MKLTLEEIESIAKEFLHKAYGLDLKIPVRVNNRLRSTLGSFVWRKYTKGESKTVSEGVPIEIEISGKYLKDGKMEDIISTVKHECCHYALFTLGKPYSDGDHYFESELRKYGIHSTGTVVFKRERNVRVYQCGCKEYVFQRTITPSYCGLCGRDLRYKERRRVTI